MGFPMGCSEFTVPKLVVYIVISLAHLRRLVAGALALLGLSDHLLLRSAPPAAVPPLLPLRPSSPSRVKDALPSAPYRRPAAAEEEEESCAVCLYEFEDGDDVRRLRECSHVFHRRCLDPWVDLGRRTCPLCRAPLLPGEGAEAEDDELLDAGFDEPELLEYSVEEDLDWRAADPHAPPLRFLNADELLLAARMR